MLAHVAVTHTHHIHAYMCTYWVHTCIQVWTYPAYVAVGAIDMYMWSMHAHMHTCIQVWTYPAYVAVGAIAAGMLGEDLHACMHACLHVYVCMYVCMYACMHAGGAW